MAINSRLQVALAGILPEGEKVLASSFGQVKSGSGAKRLAKDMGVSLAISAALTATGFGVMRNTMPAQVWLVLTPKRLLMFEKPDGHRSLGELVFDGERDALVLSNVPGVLDSA